MARSSPRLAHLGLSSLALALTLAASPLLGGCERPASTGTSASPDGPVAPIPPVAKVVPHRLEAHGHVRVDDYYWLRDREDPEVLAYLEAENAYTRAMTADSEPLREQLYAELTGRLKQDDATVPIHDRGNYYYLRWREGDDYPLYCRKQGSLDAPEQILLDGPKLAAGHEFYDIGDFAVSEDQQLLAYSDDVVGRRIHTIHIQDLRTGTLLPDTIRDVSGSIAWANDNRTLFYTKQDPQTLREHQIWRHTLGTDPSSDVLVYEEADETFSLGLAKTKSRKYLVLESSQTLSSEVRLLDADNPNAQPWVVQPRERGLEYEVDHRGDTLYIRTNLDAPNFRLVTAPVRTPGKQHWRELLAHEPEVLVEGVELFADYYVVGQRRAGLVELVVHRYDRAQPSYPLSFADPAYLAYPTGNRDPDSNVLRYAYESMTTPESIYDFDLGARTQTLRKQDQVLGGFDPANYASERLWAPARDGVRVPISLVYRKRGAGEAGLGGPRPLLLYGYGSYGSSSDPDFSSAILSLLDRDFVFAIAHVRGGEELGRPWYEGGKLFHKLNTFTDFIDSAEFLRAEGYADPDRLFATGGSAGGLLIGAVVNMRPELFRGAIAAVPFVDVVTTMLDETIPLTTGEYDEWGNPNDRAAYEYMLAYSPYDNVEAKDYPALLVTTGLHDSQVQYWEPAKWVAKLRARKTDHNPLLLRVDMSAGHGGQAGRLEAYEEVAFEYAFLLDLAG